MTLYSSKKVPSRLFVGKLWKYIEYHRIILSDCFNFPASYKRNWIFCNLNGLEAKGRNKMKPRKTIMIMLLIGMFVHGGGVSAASTGNLEALEKALSEYCIPKCESGCSKSFLAEYDSATGECKCGADLTYDSGLRECIIKCPAGTYAYKGTGCPAGTYASSAEACPVGMYTITIN
jgi:hypothetical protein